MNITEDFRAWLLECVPPGSDADLIETLRQCISAREPAGIWLVDTGEADEFIVYSNQRDVGVRISSAAAAESLLALLDEQRAESR